LDSFKRLVETFKRHDDKCCLLLQVTHSGERSGPFAQSVTVTPYAPAGRADIVRNKDARLLSGDEIEKIRELFVESALLAEEAGMDGFDFKMCHGYLCGELLRPSNLRDDKWGGSFENRTRFLREAAREIRACLRSKDFIMGCRLSMYEGIRGGCGTAASDEIVEDLSEMLEVVKIMGALDMDYVNVSAGIPAATGAITRPTEVSKNLVLHQLRYMKAVKGFVKEEGLGLKVIGSAFSTYKEAAPTIMEEMLAKDYVDLCGFGRQSFADPLMPKKVAAGEGVCWCVLCSGCTKLMLAQVNDGCIVFNDYYKELNKNFKA